MKLDHEEIEKRYKQGDSTYKIAQDFGYIQESVSGYLRRRGLIRKALGRDIEEKIVNQFKKLGYSIEHKNGSYPYDILFSNQRINIKSAHKTKVRGKYYAYAFDINHKDALYADYKNDYDKLWLVFLDEVPVPIYELSVNDLNVVNFLKIVNIKNTKYPLHFIGYLNIKV